MTALVRTFLRTYHERAFELAPRIAGRARILERPRVDIVLVNGGRALHVVFTAPDEPDEAPDIARCHAMTLWPAATSELKSMADERPEDHRAQVRRTAEIPQPTLAHVILWPEDGGLADSMFEAASAQAAHDMAELRALLDDRSVPEPGP